MSQFALCSREPLRPFTTLLGARRARKLIDNLPCEDKELPKNFQASSEIQNSEKAKTHKQKKKCKNRQQRKKKLINLAKPPSIPCDTQQISLSPKPTSASTVYGAQHECSSPPSSLVKFEGEGTLSKMSAKAKNYPIPPHLCARAKSEDINKGWVETIPAASDKVHPINDKPPTPSSLPSLPVRASKDAWAEAGARGWPSNPKQSIGLPKNRRRGGKSKKPYKKHVWPKARDFKPDPNAPGWGEGYVSNQDNDPDYDVRKLMDWNGGWMPPPEEWTSRHQFLHRDLGASVEAWIEGHIDCEMDMSKHLHKKYFTGFIDKDEFVEIDGQVVSNHYRTHEIIPRTWIPDKIGHCTLQQYWRELPFTSPLPHEEDDFFAWQPFWETYYRESECFCEPLLVPTYSMDKGDPEYQNPKAKVTVLEILRTQQRWHDAGEQKLLNEIDRKHVKRPNTKPAFELGDKMFIRPVKAGDATKVVELYNQFLKNSSSAIDFKSHSRTQLLERIMCAIEADLPFIVAIAEACYDPYDEDGIELIPERIVGFAILDSHKGGVSRHTFDLKMHVHPHFMSKGVAQCFLDRMLRITDKSYIAKGGYKWHTHNKYLKFGIKPVVRAINLSVPHASTHDMKGFTKLMESFDFSRHGHLEDMGYKEGKIADVSIYQHINRTKRDANEAPESRL